MALCQTCGNEVDDANACPICNIQRERAQPEAAPEPPKPEPERPAPPSDRCTCPRCDDVLEDQSWDGTVTLCCPTCNGAFFPDRALEAVLDKLRATIDHKDAESVLEDFKDRFHRELPDAVRYKNCPVCNTVMTRRAYGTVSGVIIDTCPDHGKWVDETQFAALADFICRGGDTLAAKVDQVRDRIAPRAGGGGSGKPAAGTLLSRFFGGR